MMIEDARAKQAGICGVTRTGSSGIEWICVKPVHGKVYRRHASGRRGQMIFASSVSVDSHYYIPRWVRDDEEKATGS